MSTETTPNTAPKKYEWDDRYDFTRDHIGYGEKSFNPQWPNGAKIAVSFVINYEEVSPLTFPLVSSCPSSQLLLQDQSPDAEV
jgi:hypothetical protein